MKKPTPQQMKRIAELAKMLGHGDLAVAEKIFDVEDSLSKEIESVKKSIPSVKNGQDGEDGMNGDVGPQGPQGEKGDSIVGPAGPAGRDGADGRPGEDGISVIGPPGEAGKDGKDGKDGSPDTPTQIASKLNTTEQSVEGTVIKGFADLKRMVLENLAVAKKFDPAMGPSFADLEKLSDRIATAGGTPGGSNTQVQFNDSGSFGGDSDFTWNKTSNVLQVNGTITNNSAGIPSGDYSKIEMTNDLVTIQANTGSSSGSETVLVLGDGYDIPGYLGGYAYILADDDTANFGMNVERDALGTFSFSAAGSLRLRLGNSANDTSTAVVIDVNSDQYLLGTSGGGNLWGRSLHIKAEDNVGNAGNGGDIWLNGGVGAAGHTDGNVILANSVGMVGIKITAPVFTLDVNGTIGNSTGDLNLETPNKASPGDVNITAGSSTSNNQGGGVFILAGSGDNGDGGQFLAQAGDGDSVNFSSGGQLEFDGGRGYGSGYAGGDVIFASGTGNSGADPGQIKFKIGNSVKVLIDTSGSVGIGTTSLSGDFNVQTHTGGVADYYITGEVGDFLRMYMGKSGNSIAGVFNRIEPSADFYFGETTDTGGAIFRGSGGVEVDGNIHLTETAGGGYSDIYVASSDGYLVIDPSGGANPYVLVGFNSAIPTSMLSVAGNAVIGGNYFSAQTAPTDGLLVEGNVGIGTNTIDGKVNVLSNAGSSGLVVTGYSSGGSGAYNYIKGVNASNGKTMFVIGDDSANLQGWLCFFGESASYPVIGEFDFADRSIAVADKRIFTYQGWKDGSGNYLATLSMRKSPFTGFGAALTASAKLDGSVLIHGSAQNVSGVSILDVRGNVSIGSYAETNAAPTNGMIVSGSVGFGVTSVTAKLHIGAVGTAASSAPLKFTTGTVMTTAEAGAMEYATPDLFFTPGSAVRYNLPLVTGAGTQGDLIYASGASIYSRLAKNTTATRYLANTGTSNNPAWAQIDLTNGVTGALPVANGGTASTTRFVDNVALTNQGADITATNFTNGGTAGTYRVSYYLEDTTADATAGAVTLTIAFTDAVGATTITANQLLTGTGRTSGSAYIQLASGNVTYAVAHTGIFGTAKYGLYLSLERLS